MPRLHHHQVVSSSVNRIGGQFFSVIITYYKRFVVFTHKILLVLVCGTVTLKLTSLLQISASPHYCTATVVLSCVRCCWV